MVKEETKAVAWFELPFYRSLTEQILFLGAPRSAIMVNALIAFFIHHQFPFLVHLANVALFPLRLHIHSAK